MEIIFSLLDPIIKIVSWLVKRYRRHDFKEVFGDDAIRDFSITYGAMALRPLFDRNGNSVPFRDESGNLRNGPYYKPGNESNSFFVSSIVSLSHTRSAKYLSETFGEFIGNSPKLVSDYDISDKLDLSFCSIGGLNNLKTQDVLESNDNDFFNFDATGGIITKKGEKRRFCIHDNYDYGFIIKVIPNNFPKRAWIAIAGIGEWGTSGAAWYLAKKWKELPRNKSFGLIIKTKGGQDESAEKVHQL